MEDDERNRRRRETNKIPFYELKLQIEESIAAFSLSLTPIAIALIEQLLLHSGN